MVLVRLVEWVDPDRTEYRGANIQVAGFLIRSRTRIL
jgi:hypothetical protein